MLHCSLARPPKELIGLLDHPSVGPLLAPQMTIHILSSGSSSRQKNPMRPWQKKQARAKERKRKTESKCCHGRFKETLEITGKKREPKAPLSPAVHPPDFCLVFYGVKFFRPCILSEGIYSYAHFLSWGVFSLMTHSPLRSGSGDAAFFFLPARGSPNIALLDPLETFASFQSSSLSGAGISNVLPPCFLGGAVTSL